MKQERTIDDRIRKQSQFMSLALVVTPEPHRRALSPVVLFVSDSRRVMCRGYRRNE